MPSSPPETARTGDQNGDQEQERDGVAIQKTADENGPVGLDEAEGEACDQSTSKTAEPTDHDNRECLVADHEAHGRLDKIVEDTDQRSCEAGQRRADGEVEITHLDRIDTEALRHAWVRDGGTPADADP